MHSCMLPKCTDTYPIRTNQPIFFQDSARQSDFPIFVVVHCVSFTSLFLVSAALFLLPAFSYNSRNRNAAPLPTAVGVIYSIIPKSTLIDTNELIAFPRCTSVSTRTCWLLNAYSLGDSKVGLNVKAVKEIALL